MKLNGICKYTFDKWYIDFIKHKRRDYIKFSHEQILKKFYREIDSMKYGVYVDFFLANEIIVDIQPILDYDEDVYTKVLYYNANVTKLNFDPTFLDNTIETENIQEARTEAIKRANEVFNQNN